MREFKEVPLSDWYERIDHCLRTEHWPEVGHYRDIPIEMNWEHYLRLTHLRTYVAVEGSELLGYAIFFVSPHLHYRHTIVAQQDILYVRPKHRGFGREFILWCDDQLRILGAVTVFHHLKPWFDWGPMAESLGYEFAEKIYSRRLD